MTKNEFLAVLRSRLEGIPEPDLKKSLEFYDEMICDRMDGGMSESEAVDDLGSIDEIVRNILSDVSLPAIIKEKVKPKRRLTGLEIGLIIAVAIFAFPIWFPLLMAAFAVAISLFAVLFAVIITFFALFFAVGAASVVVLGSSVISIAAGHPAIAAIKIGGGLLGIGITILAFFLAVFIAKIIFAAIKGIIHLIKRLFVGKGKKNEA